LSHQNGGVGILSETRGGEQGLKQGVGKNHLGTASRIFTKTIDIPRTLVQQSVRNTGITLNGKFKKISKKEGE